MPFFFFQAEDGIRDLYVTGVQTCALPIFVNSPRTTAAVGALVTVLAVKPSRVAVTSTASCLPFSVADGVNVLAVRSEEHTSELQSRRELVCRLLLEKKNRIKAPTKLLGKT